jgi:Icc-related predicted phosphoesterase
MRILAAADLHYSLRQFDWFGEQAGKFDLLVLAGDLLDMGSSVDLEVQEVVVQKFLRRLSLEKVLLTSSGNHDIQNVSPEGERTALWMEELGGPALKPDYESHEQDDVVFSVCSWWDGPVSRAKAEERLARDAVREKKHWVWLHHNPPARTPVAWTGRGDGGDPVVVEWIEKYQPDLVFSGHIHNAPFYAEGGWHARMGKTWIFNPGKQLGGEPTRIVVDLGARRAEWHSVEGVETVEL